MALPKDEVLFHLKFIDSKYLDQFLNGTLSFSCPGFYIERGEQAGNTEEGDRLEAVFAHLLKSNPQIAEMRTLLGKDLEEIEDGNFVFLRRQSVKLIPVFCTYGYTISKVYRDGYHFDNGRHNIQFIPEDRLYTGFSETSVLIKCATYYDKIDSAVKKKHLSLTRKCIKYVDFTKEFFIEPKESFDELFVKSMDYAKQEEYRLCLIGESLADIHDRWPFFIGKFLTNSEVYINSDHMMYEFSLMFGEHGEVISI